MQERRWAASKSETCWWIYLSGNSDRDISIMESRQGKSSE